MCTPMRETFFRRRLKFCSVRDHKILFSASMIITSSSITHSALWRWVLECSERSTESRVKGGAGYKALLYQVTVLVAISVQEQRDVGKLRLLRNTKIFHISKCLSLNNAMTREAIFFQKMWWTNKKVNFCYNFLGFALHFSDEFCIRA